MSHVTLMLVNCRVSRRLQTSTRPAQPPPMDLRAHIAYCWDRQDVVYSSSKSLHRFQPK